MWGWVGASGCGVCGVDGVGWWWVYMVGGGGWCGRASISPLNSTLSEPSLTPIFLAGLVCISVS